MRMSRSGAAVLVSLCLAAFACGHGSSAGQCQHNFDCAAGEGCVNGKCEALPCGGCQPDEACGADGNCVTAQGATCADHTCPSGYPCNSGGVCAKPCTLNQDCDPGFFCNSALKSCVECSFNSDCTGKAGKPVCDTDPSAGTAAATGHGSCVACNVNFDCVKALGTGHYCDAHACKVGCKSSDDCNSTLNETCDTTVSPGKCIQCKTNADCAAQGPAASACDNTGHCVQCWGADQAAANVFCGSGTPECNLATKSCVECITSNNASGADCGYNNSGTMDPHDARTCNPATLSCIDGCEFDSQCGCPRTAPGGAESACARFPDQEHCDKTRTTMVGVTGATVGACVQCTDNTHCEYKIKGSTQYGGTYASLNGARCVNDSCQEGCDTDADCWPDHTTTNGKICHLGADANNHKCVECKCEVLSADGTYCETTSAGARACNNTAGGSPQVCDKSTLLCRKKRQNEMCVASNECGDIHDPTIGACVPGGGCVYSWHDSNTYKCDAAQSFGRCGVLCNDLQNNYCVGTEPCPVNSACRQAATESGSNTYCVALSCNK